MLGTIGMTLLGIVLWQATEPPDISGQWTSNEWGTVVLEAKGPREYEGTFTGSGRDTPAPRNDLPGGRNGGRERVKSGTLHLKWSRLERRFNGTWGKDAARSGTMSLRLVDQNIHGGFTTDEDVQLEAGTPRVGDLVWKRSAVTLPDGGTVLLGGLNRKNAAADNPRTVAPGDHVHEHADDVHSNIVPTQPPNQANHDSEFEGRLREIDKLRLERKPTIEEVNLLVDSLLATYPQNAGRIHGRAAHLYGQSGIQEFSAQVIEHATKSMALESDPVRRAYLFMYLSNASEVSGRVSKATDWFLKGWLELQPHNLPEVAPDLPFVGKYRGLVANPVENPGDQESVEKQALFMRLVEEELKQRAHAEVVRELVHFRSIYLNGLRRMNRGSESMEKLRARANELFGSSQGHVLGELDAADELIKALSNAPTATTNHANETRQVGEKVEQLKGEQLPAESLSTRASKAGEYSSIIQVDLSCNREFTRTFIDSPVRSTDVVQKTQQPPNGTRHGTTFMVETASPFELVMSDFRGSGSVSPLSGLTARVSIDFVFLDSRDLAPHTFLNQHPLPIEIREQELSLIQADRPVTIVIGLDREKNTIEQYTSAGALRGEVDPQKEANEDGVLILALVSIKNGGAVDQRAAFDPDCDR
jgi:hypothetical protein